MAIYLVSDTHFGHDRAFIYEPRGFKNIYDHDIALVKNWNGIIKPEDEVYHLGDVMLGDNTNGLKYLHQLNGKIHIIRGNHDTDTRIELYKNSWNVVEVYDVGYRLKFGKYHFVLTHKPMITDELTREKLTRCECNFYGHTHQKNNFYEDRPYMYHVGIDSHNCMPVRIEDAIADMEAKVIECKSFL